MSQAVSSDTNMLNIMKIYYTDEKLQNLLFRNSPAVNKIDKIRVQGKNYNFSAFYGRGGAVSGDYTVARANASTTARNAEFSVPPGKIFSVFNFTQQEMLASSTMRGAYIAAALDKMFAGTEAMRKTIAACFYGSGYGELGLTGATTDWPAASSSVSLALPSDMAVKLDVGSVVNVTDGALPSSTLRSGDYRVKIGRAHV